MKLFFRTFIVTLLLTNLAIAGIINGIAIVINKEPITLYEVYKYAQQLNINNKEAIEILVRQKLEDAQIKELGINTDDFELDRAIDNLALKNGISTFDFTKMLQTQNIKIQTYKKDLARKINRDKLYQRVLPQKIQAINESELQTFYDTNKNQFTIADRINVIAYISKNETDLQAITQNPMMAPQGVVVQEQSLEFIKLDARLQGILANTQERNFTQVIKLGDSATLFYIKEKQGVSYLPFEQVKNNIYNVMYNEREQKAMDDYFEKLKSSATIEVFRNPS
ncbi:MAG: peptidyl-prolyl cis-trans isomerase [Sulfurospirillum sp.]|nr:peptidyl-prolyl cis-trans isomerase [Sulfurospirillum sp.]